MSNKIKTEVRYNGMSFNFIREVKGLKMYFSEDDNNYCIIVDKDGTVLFRVRAECGQNTGYLEDAAD